MPVRYYICPIVGTGTPDVDPYRPKVDVFSVKQQMKLLPVVCPTCKRMP